MFFFLHRLKNSLNHVFPIPVYLCPGLVVKLVTVFHKSKTTIEDNAISSRCFGIVRTISVDYKHLASKQEYTKKGSTFLFAERI